MPDREDAVEKQEPLRSLSIFLLKETVEGPRDAVRDPEALAWYDVKDLDGVVATRPTTPKPPWWVEYLAPRLQEPRRSKLSEMPQREHSSFLGRPAVTLPLPSARGAISSMPNPTSRTLANGSSSTPSTPIS